MGVANRSSVLIGSTLAGRYRIDRLITSGGFATVYAGVHCTLGAPVAIKVLRLAAHDSELERAELVNVFFREARILPTLRHPNIVSAWDLGLLPPDASGVAAPYIVMEWCEGETFADYLGARNGLSLPITAAFALLDPIVDAIAHAHERGVVHCDLKPANLMLVRDEAGHITPRVIDFGVARIVSPGVAVSSGNTTTASSMSAYTPAYAAPEQVARSRSGPWTDVHALALLWVETLTGRRAYGDEGSMAAIDPVRPTPKTFGVDVGYLEPVLARALSLRPADRHRDARELRDDLRRAYAGTRDRAPSAANAPLAANRPSALSLAAESGAPYAINDRTVGGLHAPPKTVRVRPPRAGVIGAATLVFVLLGAVAYVSLRPRPAPLALRAWDHLATRTIASIPVSVPASVLASRPTSQLAAAPRLRLATTKEIRGLLGREGYTQYDVTPEKIAVMDVESWTVAHTTKGHTPCYSTLMLANVTDEKQFNSFANIYAVSKEGALLVARPRFVFVAGMKGDDPACISRLVAILSDH